MGRRGSEGGWGEGVWDAGGVKGGEVQEEQRSRIRGEEREARRVGGKEGGKE